MNIVRCWSRSIGYFFNPRLFFKELSDYFSVAYKSMLLYSVIATTLWFGNWLLLAAVLHTLPFENLLRFTAITELLSALENLMGYFFVIFGKKIKSLKDLFIYGCKSLAMFLCLFIVMWLVKIAYKTIILDAIFHFVRHREYFGSLTDIALGSLRTLAYGCFAIYFFFVFDGVVYCKGIGRALNFCICNLPFLAVWVVLNFWYKYFLFVRHFITLGLFYAGSYFLLSILYLYYERMKKYVR